MPFSVQLQDSTTQHLLTYLELALYVVLILTWWVFTPSALRLAIELQHARPRLPKALRKSKQLVGTLALLFRDGKLDEVPQNEKQKVATGPLRDKLHEQDFAGPISFRASKVLGRVADILPHMKLVSRASRPGLTVGVLCNLCNGLCTALRFHTEEHEHTCRVGCLNELDSLTLQRVSLVVRYIYFLLGTCFCTSTEKPSSA